MGQPFAVATSCYTSVVPPSGRVRKHGPRVAELLEEKAYLQVAALA